MVWLSRFLFAWTICLGLLGCAQNKVPTEALQLSPESLEDRQLQTRVFDTQDEAMLLTASAALLQDVGFNIDESETELGVIRASKMRDARESDQIAGAIFLLLLTGAVGAPVMMPTDHVQRMFATVVSVPHGETGNSTAVRVTFHRVVWNDRKQISKQERLNNPEAYQEFFSKLSKSVFLEAHEL
jgi:hypothetical protein